MEIQLSDSARWFCAVTRPSRLDQAEKELAAIGYRSFTPKHRRWTSHARVKVAKEKPLLGRYLFVGIDHPRQSFRKVTEIHSIEAMVSVAKVPCVFPSKDVENLLQRYLAGEWDEVEGSKFAVGARIRILEGEFDNMLATVTSVKGHKITCKLLDRNKYSTVQDCSVRAA